jgi:hypothetical protein
VPLRPPLAPAPLYRTIAPPPFYPPGDPRTVQEPIPEPTAEAEPAPTQFPIPPAAAAPAYVLDAPLTALRPAAVGSDFSNDLAIDPGSLHRKLRLSSGLSSLRVDEVELRVRSGLKRESIPWTDVLGFEPRFDTSKHAAPSHGWLVVLTPQGEFDLPATRSPIAELRHRHAMLEAYRVRAGLTRGQ